MRSEAAEFEPQQGAVAQLKKSAECAKCHPDVAAQWSSSAHRFASLNNPYYAAAFDSSRVEKGAAASRFCAHPDLRGTGEFVARVTPVPYRDGHGARVRPPSLASPRFCGGCHKVGLLEEVTGERWLRGRNDHDSQCDQRMDMVHVAGGEVTLGIGVTLAEIRKHAPRGARDELAALVRTLSRPRIVMIAPFEIEREPQKRVWVPKTPSATGKPPVRPNRGRPAGVAARTAAGARTRGEAPRDEGSSRCAPGRLARRPSLPPRTPARGSCPPPSTCRLPARRAPPSRAAPPRRSAPPGRARVVVVALA